MSEVDPTTQDPREARGQRIADRFRIRQQGTIWIVPSETAEGKRYHVDPEAGLCDCPDFETRHLKCKHQWAVEYTITRETDEAGAETITQSLRVTYRQEWTAYNAAQTHEHERFLPLLRELCDGIEQPAQTFGRPRLPLSDVVFALGVKTYSTLSGRRAASYVREAEALGLMKHAPHYNSGFRYLENADLTGVLKALVEESAKPLASVEADFAIDSTGFATTTYHRWYDHKWGRERSKQSWVKLHIATGVKTNIVTAADASATETADAPQLPHLLNTTARTFAIGEVSADKAYSSKRNLHAIEGLGGMPYIPFRQTATGKWTHGHGYEGLWGKMFHYYAFNRDDFLAHYHKRSNVETTMGMIKTKFGAAVRAKTPTAQVNETLLKVLCHNICVLIQSIYELDLEPVFWLNPSCPKSQSRRPLLRQSPSRWARGSASRIAPEHGQKDFEISRRYDVCRTLS